MAALALTAADVSEHNRLRILDEVRETLLPGPQVAIDGVVLGDRSTQPTSSQVGIMSVLG